jgi:FkbM family methyltransferase
LADLVSGALMIDAGVEAIARVRENLQLNRLDDADFIPVCKAVGEASGEVYFSDIGGAHTQNRVVRADGEPGVKTRRVEMTTIDLELARIGRKPTFIKVDVEGQDLAALKGAVATLRAGTVKLVKFERLPQEPLAPLVDFFDELGWEVFALDRRGRRTWDSSLIERSLNLFASPAATRDQDVK